MLKVKLLDGDPRVIAAKVLQDACHGAAFRSGWWQNNEGQDIRENPLTFSNKLMLTVSELSEAMEADRKGLMDDKLPHRPGREVEVADAIIRLFDLAGGYGLDIAGAIAEKLEYNAQRADHKIENRKAVGGKAY
jgi:NTP pyrophosphatase (non-canonical NTP hydrolase)